MLGYWICGFALQMGGVGGVASLGGATGLDREFVIHLFGKDFGLFGTKGFFLTGVAYDAVIFCSIPVPDGLYGHYGHYTHGLHG